MADIGGNAAEEEVLLVEKGLLGAAEAIGGNAELLTDFSFTFFSSPVVVPPKGVGALLDMGGNELPEALGAKGFLGAAVANGG